MEKRGNAVLAEPKYAENRCCIEYEVVERILTGGSEFYGSLMAAVLSCAERGHDVHICKPKDACGTPRIMFCMDCGYGLSEPE
jgi:hypothetical protein